MNTEIKEKPIAKQEPKVKFKAEIFETKEYSMFKNTTGNRLINLLHLQRLMKSMQEEYLMSPIIVNHELEIIDGQHRFEAARRLELPVYFFKVKDYGLQQIHRLNSNTENWNAYDFAKSYAESGNENYQAFLDFKKEYGFGVRATISLLTGTANGKYGKGLEEFAKGTFQVKDLDEARENAKKIIDFKPFYAGYLRRSFVAAIIRLIYNPKYNHEEMLQKMEMRPRPIYHFPNITQYLEVLEEIYNYKRHGEKPRFR